MLRLVAVFISFVLLSGTAQALTDQDRVEVERLRVYLNDITTMQNPVRAGRWQRRYRTGHILAASARPPAL